MCAETGTSFWNWATLSSAVNVIGFAVLAVTVPVLQWFFRTQRKRKEERRTREDARILDITKPVIKPLEEKIQKIDSSLKDMTYMGDKINKTLEKMSISFEDLKTKQIETNTKINYIDSFFQSSTKMTHPNKHDDEEDTFDRDRFKEQNAQRRRKGRDGFK